jgi:hypothetical protein
MSASVWTFRSATALATTALLAVSLTTIAGGAAKATGIEGQTIDVKYVWPTLGSIYADLGSVVAATIPQPLSFGSYFTVSVSSAQIVIGQSNYGGVYSGSFNGQYIVDESVLEFPSYTVDPSSVLGGGTPTMAVAGDTLEINFAGLTFGPGEQLVLDLGPVAAPEPGSLGMLAAGCGFLLLARRGRPRRA